MHFFLGKIKSLVHIFLHKFIWIHDKIVRIILMSTHKSKFLVWNIKIIK